MASGRSREAHLLRLYVNASERWEFRPLYQAIVETAYAEGIAGALVYPVARSYGSHGRLHDATSDYTFADLPVVIELVDDPAAVTALLDRIVPMLRENLATITSVHIVASSRQGGISDEDPEQIFPT